jgi:S-adenosylmethionine hydrolase
VAVITLTTDLGSGPYAASMKGAILRVNPRARIVDISHEIPPHDIAEGAYVLLAASQHFPKAIHVGVVDPGVGGPRKSILFSTRNGLFLGPDNGLLVPAVRASGLRSAYLIENEKLMADSIHPTFHGRDVFAPVAAHLSLGAGVTSVGRKTTTWVDLRLEEWRHADDQIDARVLHVDRFGNLITSLPAAEVRSIVRPANTYLVGVRKWSGLVPHVNTYAEADEGRLVLLESSSGFVELAVREGSAAELTGAKRGDRVSLVLT